MSGLCPMSDLSHASVLAYKEIMGSLQKGMNKAFNELMGLQLGMGTEDIIRGQSFMKQKDYQFMGCCLA